MSKGGPERRKTGDQVRDDSTQVSELEQRTT